MFVAAVCLRDTDKNGITWPESLHGHVHRNNTLCPADSDGNTFVLKRDSSIRFYLFYFVSSSICNDTYMNVSFFPGEVYRRCFRGKYLAPVYNCTRKDISELLDEVSNVL